MTSSDRWLPAPQLRETADIWFDTGVDPIICWDPPGHRYWLADGAGGADRLTLLTLGDPPPVPSAQVALALRDGLAACDFPPTDSGVPRQRAIATLRAAGIDIS